MGIKFNMDYLQDSIGTKYVKDVEVGELARIHNIANKKAIFNERLSKSGRALENPHMKGFLKDVILNEENNVSFFEYMYIQDFSSLLKNSQIKKAA